MEQLEKKKMTKKKWKSIRLFLYVAPFIALVIIFSYYPLYGWIYAFYDYRPPKPFSEAQFVGLKWFKSLVENDVKIQQIVQVLKNTFAMSALTLGTSWLPMLFAVFLNEIRCVKFRKFVQTIGDLAHLRKSGRDGRCQTAREFNNLGRLHVGTPHEIDVRE